MIIDNKNCWKRILETQLFLLDLDGTVYLENELIPGVKNFTQYLNRFHIPYVFITNNSSHSAKEYLTKITRLGIKVTIDNILTSGQASGLYLSKICHCARIFVVGTQALKDELSGLGHQICENSEEPVDYIVVGFDTELTYAKIKAACTLIDKGAGFIATNPDLVCPIKGKRYIPDCGSIYTMIENATGKRAVIIGKPNSTIIDIVKERYDLSVDKISVIGDRLYTDIALGRNNAIFTFCVLSGESTIDDIKKSPWKPDQVISSIDFLNGAFQQVCNRNN